jgi:hypothetical protein
LLGSRERFSNSVIEPNLVRSFASTPHR